jgi:hypothetical protein
MVDKKIVNENHGVYRRAMKLFEIEKARIAVEEARKAAEAIAINADGTAEEASPSASAAAATSAATPSATTEASPSATTQPAIEPTETPTSTPKVVASATSTTTSEVTATPTATSNIPCKIINSVSRKDVPEKAIDFFKSKIGAGKNVKFSTDNEGDYSKIDICVEKVVDDGTKGYYYAATYNTPQEAEIAGATPTPDSENNQ